MVYLLVQSDRFLCVLKHEEVYVRSGYESLIKFRQQETCVPYTSVSQTFVKWGPLSLVRMFYGPPYSWDYETH